jgi:hypothetical protein
MRLARGGLILYRIEVNNTQIFNNATLYFGDRIHDTATVRAPLDAAHGTQAVLLHSITAWPAERCTCQTCIRFLTWLAVHGQSVRY